MGLSDLDGLSALVLLTFDESVFQECTVFGSCSSEGRFGTKLYHFVRSWGADELVFKQATGL